MSDLTLTDHRSKLTATIEGHALKIDYGWAEDGVMRVDFVEVPPELGGRGLGTALVAALVEKARTEGFRLAPVCGFARKKLTEREDWWDVLA